MKKPRTRKSPLKQLDMTALATVTGGVTVTGPDTPGVMEPVNRKHLTEWELQQDC